MKRTNFAPMVLLIGMTLPALSGCLHGSHPDEKAAVYGALDKNNLRSVMVAQDRHTGVLTLSGIVDDDGRRVQAETVARNAAPGYTVSDRIQVRTTGLQNLEKAPQAK